MTTRINISDDQIPWLRFAAMHNGTTMTDYVEQLIEADREAAPYEMSEAYDAFVASVLKSRGLD